MLAVLNVYLLACFLSHSMESVHSTWNLLLPHSDLRWFPCIFLGVHKFDYCIFLFWQFLSCFALNNCLFIKCIFFIHFATYFSYLYSVLTMALTSLLYFLFKAMVSNNNPVLKQKIWFRDLNQMKYRFRLKNILMF